MDCYHKLALKFYVKRYTMDQKTRKAGCTLWTAIVVCCLKPGELFTLDLSKEHLHFPLVEGISLSNRTEQEDFYSSTSWKAVKIERWTYLIVKAILSGQQQQKIINQKHHVDCIWVLPLPPDHELRDLSTAIAITHGMTTESEAFIIGQRHIQ